MKRAGFAVVFMDSFLGYPRKECPKFSDRVDSQERIQEDYCKACAKDPESISIILFNKRMCIDAVAFVGMNHPIYTRSFVKI